MLRVWLFLHLEWGLSCALRLQVEEQSLFVLRLRLLLERSILLLLPLLCPARLAISSDRRSPALAGVAIARPAMGPAVLGRSALGIVLLPRVLLLASGRSPIGLLQILLKMTEPRLLLPFLDVRLEVLLAILSPLRHVTACLVLALRAGGPRSSAGAERYRSGFGGRLSPAPSGEADDDRSSALDALDIDWDDSFWSALALIRNFHSMEEPVGVPSARWKTSLASIYELMSETSPAFHLPTSPLMRSLLDDTNLALSKFFGGPDCARFLTCAQS